MKIYFTNQFLKVKLGSILHKRVRKNSNSFEMWAKNAKENNEMESTENETGIIIAHCFIHKRIKPGKISQGYPPLD